MTRQVESLHDEEVGRWRAQIAHYSAVKQNFAERKTRIESELKSWQERLATLEADYANADRMMAQLRDQIAKAERLKRTNESLRSARKSGSPVRTKESKVAKARRLELELAKLQREIAAEGQS